MTNERRDELTDELTAFPTFSELTEANYTPTINPKRGGKYLALANAYDEAMKEAGDHRRAFRG